eukprot:SM000027S09600  [mRNA]  locus=s27:214467:215041:- [translate_table: standard]
MVFRGAPRFEEGPPDSFDAAVRHDDPAAFLEQREHVAREALVRAEAAKLLRDRLRACYHLEGVNHTQNCRELVSQYMEAIKTAGWGKRVHARKAQAEA